MTDTRANSALSRRDLVATAARVAAAVALPLPALAQAVPVQASRTLPARPLPVPTTVSPTLQERIAAPYPADWNDLPRDAATWKARAAKSAADVAPFLPPIKQHFGLQVTNERIAGVPCLTIVPADLPAENRGRVLLHLHGGGYVLFPGEAGAGEGMLMAGFGRFKVISVDYRMPPDFPFPAALDDAIAVWGALLAAGDPRRMAIFGSSAGGGLTLATVLRAKAEGLALPAAMAPGTPWVDLAGMGDSRQANAFVDNVLVADTGWVGAAAALYAGGRDLSDPLVSPIHGDFTGLPPAILTSGTRDLLLSDTVRTHRKLRQAGVDAALQVFEGMSHAQYLDASIPEAKEAFDEIARFFAARLAA